jgi:hypothetical protein
MNVCTRCTLWRTCSTSAVTLRRTILRPPESSARSFAARSSAWKSGRTQGAPPRMGTFGGSRWPTIPMWSTTALPTPWKSSPWSTRPGSDDPYRGILYLPGTSRKRSKPYGRDAERRCTAREPGRARRGSPNLTFDKSRILRRVPPTDNRQASASCSGCCGSGATFERKSSQPPMLELTDARSQADLEDAWD